MSLVQCVAAWFIEMQLAAPSGPPAKIGNPLSDEYFVIAIAAAVLGLVVVVFIRSSCKRSSKR